LDKKKAREEILFFKIMVIFSDDASQTGHVRIQGAESLRIEFDRQCSTERRHDPLTIMDASGRIVTIRSGRDWSDWSPEIRVAGENLSYTLHPPRLLRLSNYF